MNQDRAVVSSVSALLSLTPGFSPVIAGTARKWKPFKQFQLLKRNWITGLKHGANETLRG
jgi:hypothetical protein